MANTIKVLVTIGLLIILASSGCIMAKHRRYVREGVMAVGLNREAFLKERGKPDIQFMQNEFQEAAPGLYEDSLGRFGQRRPANGVEAWVYREHNWMLVFYGSD